MAKTLVYMRTHVIDKGVISEFLKLKNTCGYDCILLIDNHKELFVPKSEKKYICEKEFFGHKIKCFFTDDILYKDHFNLPYYSEQNDNKDFAKMMWYCADYVFYAVRKFFPDYERYWQFEYDVYCNGDSYKPFLNEYDVKDEELIIARLENCAEMDECFWADKADWVYASNITKYSSFFPIVRISGKAIDFLYNKRLEHLNKFDPHNALDRWIFCEIFVPTELLNAGFKATSIDNQPMRFVPNYDLNEDRIFENPDNKIYHPVRANFVRTSNVLELDSKDVIKVYRLWLFGFKFSLVIQKFR